MSSDKSPRDDQASAQEPTLSPLGWPPSGLLGAISFATQLLFGLALWVWVVGLFGFLGDDIERLAFWVMVGSFGCSVLTRLPAYIPAARRRARDIADIVESASPRLEELMAEISAKTAALVDLDQEIMDRKVDLDATVRELRERRKEILVSVDRATEMHSELVRLVKDVEKRGNRSAWIFFLLGTLVSIPVGVLVNMLTS